MSKKKPKKKRRNNRASSNESHDLSQPNISNAKLAKPIANAPSKLQFFARQIGWTNYALLLICVGAQACTIWISWTAWEFRPIVDGSIPNLPWIPGTPQFSTGVLLLLSLGFAVVSPKRFGVMIHLGILLASIGMDQFRCQPQILSIALMMAACVWPTARRICIWYLIAMWTWAGIHKLVSPDWFGPVCCNLLGDFRGGLANLGLELDLLPSDHYKKFAAIVAISEIATGLLAWFRPKFGAIVCVLLHIGIAVFLLIVNWNFSVLPWNTATAIVGAWLLWNAPSDWKPENETSEVNSNSWFSKFRTSQRVKLPPRAWEKCIVIVLLLLPIGFYFGVVRHCFAHALYSNNLPLGVMTRGDRFEFLDSWDSLKLPFPNVERTYLDYFRLTGTAGDRLHVFDTMTKTNSYFEHDGAGEFRISEQEFYLSEDGEPDAIGIDDPRKIFALELAGANMLKRSADEMIYAVSFAPHLFRPEHLELLSGVPNVEQIQLKNCRLSDEDLDRLPILPRLLGIGLSETAISDTGIAHLEKHPRLQIIEYEGTVITPGAVSNVIDN